MVLAGRRAAPPEDCGGVTDGAELAELLGDPEAFDVDAINARLRSPYVALSEHNLDRRLIDLINRLTYSPVGEGLERRAAALMSDLGPSEARQLENAFRAFTWFLDRAGGGTDRSHPRAISDRLTWRRRRAWCRRWAAGLGRRAARARAHRFCTSVRCCSHSGCCANTKALCGSRVLALQLSRPLRSCGTGWRIRLVPAESDFNSDAALLLLAYAARSADAELPSKRSPLRSRQLGGR